MSRCLFALVLVFAGCSGSAAGPAPPSSSSAALRIHGPFVHEHLALYVVEDPAAPTASPILTLAEGMASGQVKVTEKSQAEVKELMIENGSDLPCFVQAGDVVQGGQQDRTITRDFILPPKSPPQPVSSFCVEEARWAGSAGFTSNSQNAYGNDLKFAVQKESDQGRVWENVRRQKGQLRKSLALEAGKSTSLNEELEDGKVRERLDGYRRALGKALEDRPAAVGIVVAVNGKLRSADLYEQPGLLARLFPKLLDSAALDALSTKAEPKPAPAPAEVLAFLKEAEQGTQKREQVREKLEACTTENAKTVQFDYLWEGRRVHRQSLAK